MQNIYICLFTVYETLIISLSRPAVPYHQGQTVCTGPDFSWKNGLEELDLSHSLCVCIQYVLYLPKCMCVFVYECAYLQPYIFVPPHSVRVLQSVAVVSAIDVRATGCVL